MVYSNRFVACVLLNGTPQRELANGVVPIPFNSEYSLRFRNKHNRRACVKFTIDGESVCGGGYIIGANSSIDIHRHFDKDARFKFVSLDSPDAVDAGKNGPNEDGTKGLIEAKFYLEKNRKLIPGFTTNQWNTITTIIRPNALLSTTLFPADNLGYVCWLNNWWNPFGYQLHKRVDPINHRILQSLL